MYINTFHYKPEHVDCTLCTELTPQTDCTANACPWLAERMEAGTAGYEEAVMEALPRDPHLDARLHTLIRRFTGSLFLTPVHRRRMEDMRTGLGCRPKRDTRAYYAAMYLLTANDELCSRTSGCFRRYGIEFDCAAVRGISPHNYTLLSAARDIYTDSAKLTVSDLANGEVVDTLAFSLIVNALLVARYGCPILHQTTHAYTSYYTRQRCC